ncbi:MAG: ribosomal protein S18-alanine N-acetyltransferase [Clostridia bacterium]|nr:ribosomal protein S18-alanine N-acetyltransferase [Clostridia bacterium]
MTVRAWTEGDLPEIGRIEAECFKDPWCVAMWRGTFTRSDFTGFVLEENGALVGFAAATVLFEDAELLRIAVYKNERGKGHGGKLLDTLLENAKARGAEKMFLEVRESNATARGLYESRGFIATGVRKKYYADGEDAVAMVKTL